MSVVVAKDFRELPDGEYLVKVIAWTERFVERIGKSVTEIDLYVSNHGWDRRLAVIECISPALYRQQKAEFCREGWHIATIARFPRRDPKQGPPYVRVSFEPYQAVEDDGCENNPTIH